MAATVTLRGVLHLPGLSLSAFFAELPRFIGLGFIGVGAMIATIFVLSALRPTGPHGHEIWSLALIGYLIAAHVLFVLVASRAVGRRLDSVRYSAPLPVTRWPLAFLGLTVLASGIAMAAGNLPLAAVLAAVFVSTPLVPALALNRSLRAALKETIGLLPLFLPLSALLSALPLSVAWLLGDVIQSCEGECWGMFEGGIVGFPLLALHMFLAASTVAVVPTAVYVILTAPPRSTASAFGV